MLERPRSEGSLEVMLICDVVNYFAAVHQRIRCLKGCHRSRGNLVLTSGGLCMIHLKLDATSLQGMLPV